MTTTPELEAEIIRLHYAEHWRVGTIARQLGVHPDAVRRVLGIGEAQPTGGPRPRLCDPFRDFIAETLTRYPRLRATRLYDMLRERGYKGAARTLRTYVVPLRPVPRREVYLRTEPLVGKQAQIDWAHASKLPGGERAVWLFVMVLSYSRALWGEFVLDLSVHSLCRSVRAARAFGGTARQWLFDNPKTVVLERRADAVRFHPTLLDLCAKMRGEPRLCAVRRPEHKGRVERAIRSRPSTAVGIRPVSEEDDPVAWRLLLYLRVSAAEKIYVSPLPPRMRGLPARGFAPVTDTCRVSGR